MVPYYLTSKVYLYIRCRTCLIQMVHDLDRPLIIMNIATQNYKHSHFFFVWLCHKCFFKKLRFPILRDYSNFPKSHLSDIAFVQNLKYHLSFVPVFQYTISTKVIKTGSYKQIYHFRGLFSRHFNYLFFFNKEKVTLTL